MFFHTRIQGTVEFVAPVEYMVRPPQAPVYVFVIDVSYPSVSSGVVHTVCAAIKSCLDSLPGGERTQVCVLPNVCVCSPMCVYMCVYAECVFALVLSVFSPACVS